MPPFPPGSRDPVASPRGLRAFARYLVVGIANTAASYALFVVLELVLPYLAAYTIAFVAGIALSYLLNTRIVFRVARSWSTAVRFPLVYALQFALGGSIIVALVEGAGVGPRLAALAALVVTVPVTYFAARLVFRRRRGG